MGITKEIVCEEIVTAIDKKKNKTASISIYKAL